MAGHHQVTQPSTLLEGGVQAAAPAKINRFLHIVGRRADGYHLLETGFQFVQWCDWIHFRPTEIPGIHLLHDPLGLGEQNLVFQAAAQVLDQTSHGVEILIEKHLPSGGGLGGGSSDAATTLVALNDISGSPTRRCKRLDSGLARMFLSLFLDPAALPKALARNSQKCIGRGLKF
jgi:4-diphosphocytidyl-2-C-methyl-D-erythritol kinase